MKNKTLMEIELEKREKLFMKKLDKHNKSLENKTKNLQDKLDKTQTKRSLPNRFVSHVKEKRERDRYKMSKEGIKEKLQEIKDFKKLEKIRKFEAKRRDEKKVFKTPSVRNFGGFGEGVFESSFNSGRPVVRKKRR